MWEERGRCRKGGETQRGKGGLNRRKETVTMEERGAIITDPNSGLIKSGICRPQETI